MTTPPLGQGKTSRWLLTALVVSLLLNAFAFPFVAGAMLGTRLPALLMARSQVNLLLGELPQEKQKELRDIIQRQIIPELQQRMHAQAALRLKLADAIARPDVNEAELKASFETIRAHTGEMQGDFQERITKIILSLNPAERAQLADGLRKTITSGEAVRGKLGVVGR